ncbi:MAG TPA: tRNA preQ1(34) S-adenosylmethionine ribosyltransferase-isomerase QueA [Terriglobales bacterium]|nr:tRNA preQ1(34) S-adenosylmethionine ribosyltransferase-isomerase QueA [Terriglobales bacterium]
MLVSDFDYHLPPELIAQRPLADRAGARMLHLVRPSSDASELLEDRMFHDFCNLLRPSDLLVLNNTRVFPARLYGHRSGARSHAVSARNRAARDFLKGQVEVLLTRQTSADPPTWQALVRPGRKIGLGEILYFSAGENQPTLLQAEVIARGDFGERTLRFDRTSDFFAAIERLGHVPLPPYIDRADESSDRERYQTVFAREHGSVAAPTAGLHFTPEILARVEEHGVETAEITLHVGLGTFQPVHAETVEEHRIHPEWFHISPEAAAAINRAQTEQRRVVAVGTTSVRTLEYVALHAKRGELQPQTGEADLFIYPGFQFRTVGAMLTNFHLPQSTLLMLVSAFAGRERALRSYEYAVRQRYRFYSYGDCMFIE